MNKATKEITGTKDRIVVLEKGKEAEMGSLGLCCAGTIMPIRAGW